MAKNMGCYDAPDGVEILGRYVVEFAKILTKDALQFVAGLQREFCGRIRYAMECWWRPRGGTIPADRRGSIQPPSLLGMLDFCLTGINLTTNQDH